LLTLTPGVNVIKLIVAITDEEAEAPVSGNFFRDGQYLAERPTTCAVLLAISEYIN